VIGSDTPAADIVQSHTSLGFDRVPIMRDLNISFPIDRVRELVARGELGGLAPNNYSFMGAQRDVGRIEGETGPEAARRLRAEGVDVAFLTPTDRTARTPEVCWPARWKPTASPRRRSAWSASTRRR